VGADYDLLVWTTTPWTLVSNIGVAVGPQISYVRVRSPEGGRDLVMAQDRVGALFGEHAEIVGAVPVDDLVGARYERPFDFLDLPDGGPGAPDAAWTVVPADYVTVEDGSGMVHLAPAFGEIDREVADEHGLPMLNPVGAAATFEDLRVPEDLRGRFVKDTDADLIERLRTAGRLVAVVDYTHSYPHCWRCGTPLVYWAKPTWFARTSDRKADLIRENETIGWHPEHIKHGRFGDWLENNVDWALSRDRFWGTPLPVWRCDGGHDTCVGSVADLAERSGRDLTDLDLHRPYVDEITFPCPQCGELARRIEPVLDAWFDSGAMPAAQLHYPFEHEQDFERRFPADFICEAIDQTRGWFYSLLAVNTLVFGHTPYRNVVCLALLVDKDGQKMSKSRGNVVDPWIVLDGRGADALRWNMFAASSPWTPKRVFLEGIDETTRQFLLTLWNTYSFFVTYANLDGFVPATAPPPVDHVLDRWIRSRLHDTIRSVTEALESFDALAGAQALESFVDDLSNWYVRRSRPRFWKSSDTAAHATLHECLSTVARLLAPFCPFLTDVMHRNLARGAAGDEPVESVHLCDWPDADEAALDAALEADMAVARHLVSLGRAARDDAQLGVRQPLRRAIVLLRDDEALPPAVLAEVADELNVKSIEIVTTLEGLLDYSVVPNFRSLGPRLGPRMPKVKEALLAVDGAEVRRAFDEERDYVLEVDGEQVSLGPGDVEVRAERHAELALAQESGRAVALDLALDDELVAEGQARTAVRALNDLRKSLGLEIADRIGLRLVVDEESLHGALTRHATWIAGEVLATTGAVDRGDPSACAQRVDIAGTPVGVEITTPG
jgi:isoleucyl-tRNA synthetase